MNKEELSKENRCILILAGKVKLRNYNFVSHEYLYNVGSSLAYEKIIKKLDLESNVKIYIAIAKLNKNFLNFLPFKNANFIEVGNTDTVVDSISNAIKKIPETYISIIPITTIPDEVPLKNKTCYFGITKIPKENWSSIKIDDKKNINFLNKSDQKSYGLMSYPFTGRLFAEKCHLEESVALIKGKMREDILSIVEILITKFGYKLSFEKWFDIGHEATYMNSKLSSISSRYFNNVNFQESTNSIIKSSQNIEKLTNEFHFYKALSDELKNFFPFIYSDYKVHEQISHIRMEFIPFPNLAEIFLFRNIGPNAWLRIISSIKNVYSAFYKQEKYKIEKNCDWLYSSKLLERFQATIEYIEKSNNEVLKRILNHGICLNNLFFIDSLYSTVDKLNNFLIDYEKSIKQFIGHGDLCFNNILVDQISGCIKLIDPKSYFDKETRLNGLIDPNYDLAKLNHSFKFLYDSIVNNLFSINHENNSLNLKIYAPSEYALANKFFKEILINENIDEDLLSKITASLFISMLPLHIDNENRMICFAILGTIAFKNFDLKKLIVQI